MTALREKEGVQATGFKARREDGRTLANHCQVENSMVEDAQESILQIM